MTRTVWAEARGEIPEGWTAVAWVIRNRVEDPAWWGNTPKGVCQKPWQFSCWNTNDPNRAKLLALPVTDQLYVSIKNVCQHVLDGLISDPTGGADYYEVIGVNAKWAVGQTPVATIGHQQFYKLGPRG